MLARVRERAEQVATTYGMQEARGAERRPTEAASTIRTDGSGPIDVAVLDVSATGVRFTADADLTIGQEISLGLAGAGITRAFVARRNGNQYGCTFDAPIGEEATARAFSNAPVIHLGRRGQPAEPGEADLRELYRQHRFWQIPADALFATAVMIGVAVLVWWTLAR
jgi:hypothetical protein